MVIRVEDIKENGLFREFCEPSESFPELVDLGVEEGFRVLAPLQVSLRAIRVRDMVEVEGTVSTRLHLSCGRCLRGFEAPLSTPFAVTFSRPPLVGEQEAESGGEIELATEEMGLVPYQGEEIDLREVIQEQVIMGLPLRPLCEETCPGLCPQCGKDLNEGACGCEPAASSGKFAKLKDFKVGRKGPSEE